MAYSPFSSSSAFNVPLIKHDVFVSFRGIDIRTSFLSHLTKDLHRNQIDFFVDDEKLHPGDEISPTLLRAIEQSYISLVIFSKHYASSRWCMEELVKIIECMEQYKRIVIPVFYNVDPSHVRHQKGILAEAFDVHKERYEEEIMQSWKSVLKKTANLSGIHYPSKYRTNRRYCQEYFGEIVASFNLVSLTNLDLGGCIKLVELPDLSKATKLKRLNLKGCENLCQLHPSILSIQTLEGLYLDGCKKLKSVKGNIYLKSLKTLRVRMCSRLEEFSVSSEKLTASCFSLLRIKSLPNEFCCSIYLRYLFLFQCRELIELPHNIKTLSRLVTLDVRGCCSLRSIPELPPSIEVLLANDCTSLERIFSLKAVFSLNRRQISFENCVKLEEQSLNDIGQYQMINYYDYRRMDGRICYPGYKVPEWFVCQTTEASITIELDQPYYHLLGFIFCCVVSQNIPPPYFNKLGTLNIRCEYGHVGDDVKHTFLITRLNFVPERRRNSEDHVFIWTYQFPEEDMFREIEMCDDDDSTSNQKMSFRFSVDRPEYEKRVEERKKQVFIKGCGVLPIYASTVVDVIQKLELESKLQLNPHRHNSITRQSIDALKSKMIRKIKGKSHRLLKKHE
ncbi:hypothetical protein Ahy_A02g006120 isoform A [Arachis hypogaea]|uniref:TIR domain-containing protein n=1 Tax=Arachis hypogaea TaxID=3818 RepID=A0A445E8Y2_ARAHY|nr:hypothetical protein Ahy_A02g006120 isoform A [Arachis hypogaea]